MAESIALEIAGEPMQAWADRALYWPARRRLLIADLHLGKGNTFRNAGIAVPTGGTDRDLARLDRLVAASQAASLWILGDFLHGARHAAVDAAWRGFRARHACLDIGVIAGNHDRALDAGAAGVVALPDGLSDGPFVFRHAPRAAGAGAHLICGHLHPVAKLPDVGRHPLFWLGRTMTVLPAFSLFTGGQVVSLPECAGSVVCNGSAAYRLPGHAA